MKEKYLKQFSKIVKNISELSTCFFRKVGAIVVKDNRIISEGYNGASSGMIECIEVSSLILRFFDLKTDKNSLEKFGLKYVYLNLFRKYSKEYLMRMYSRVKYEFQNISKYDLEYYVELYEMDNEKFKTEFIKKFNFVHNVYEIHAEMNAITTAAKFGISLNDSVIISTHKPCIDCAKAIVSSGIKEVYYLEDYKDSRNNNLTSDEFFELNGIKFQKLEF